MNRHPTNAKPHGGNRGASIERKGNRVYLASLSALYGDHLRLAIAATDEIRNHLRDYADTTDTPAWEAVEAADLLDSVADLLGKAVQP